MVLGEVGVGSCQGRGRRHFLFDSARAGSPPGPTRDAHRTTTHWIGGISMLDLIYTGADNAHFHAICRRANWLPGIRSDKRPCAEATDIQFIDVRYRKPDFARHLDLVRRFRPRYATVPDLSEREVSREDIRRALRESEALAPYCGVVLLVPKLPGQIDLLPKEVALGYSVPTRYGGAHYDLRELEGHQVHLLGGSPHRQLLLYRYIACFADVKSLDCNMFQLVSGFGKFWRGGRWVRHPARGSGDVRTSYECLAWSLVTIRQAWLSLFRHSRCLYCGDGLGLNPWCVWCQDARTAIINTH
jgi:hypothetical protein